MSILPPISVYVRQPPYSLSSFDKVMAPLIVSWVRDEHELFWLAPKTEPPLTPAKMHVWPGADGCPMLLCHDDRPEPLGYLELNPMPSRPLHFWIGHCIVRPDQRGMGLGQKMMSMVLAEAFDHRNASRVSLVVFPDNRAAITCYLAAGMIDVGEQRKYFQTTGAQHVMRQMSIDAHQFATNRNA
jgi:RimJ/RimL family protein N-acetyltransferase